MLSLSSTKMEPQKFRHLDYFSSKRVFVGLRIILGCFEARVAGKRTTVNYSVP